MRQIWAKVGYDPQEELPDDEFREEPLSDAQSQLLTASEGSESAKHAGGEGEREGEFSELLPPVTQA